MDIHRCRFVPYPPSAINALAFSHPSPTTVSGKTPSQPFTLRLAIGRANGDIEIWNPSKGRWYQESVLRGGKDRSIEGLVWTQDPEDVDKHGYKIPGKLRLFSIGYSTSVTEWDLAIGKPKRHSGGNYGEIWCLAAQPQSIASKKLITSGETAKPETQSIAVGCVDGAIVLLSTADDDLSFTKLVARSSKKGARVLSLTYQNRQTVVAGHADSTIRIYDLRNGQQLRNMTLGAGPKGAPRETLVWTVRCLSDGSIISGDSTGTVCFWDGKTYALVQRIKAHDADILDMAVSADGQSAFSGGMDRRTVRYKRTGGSKAGEKSRWAKVSHSRLHKHDVKAMTAFESKGLSVLASGGLDTNPIILPIMEFGKEHHRTLSSLPQQPVLLSVPKRRLVISWWDREITIWAISRHRGRQVEVEDDPETPGPRGRKLVGKIALQGDESITSVTVTPTGTLLAVSTIASIKIFRLISRKDRALSVRKLAVPTPFSSSGAKILQFSHDSKWLTAILPTDLVEVYRLSSPDSEHPHSPSQVMRKPIKISRLPRQDSRAKPEHGTLGPYDRSINRVAFSADSRILVVSDLSGYLDTWVLEGHEDLTQADVGAEDLESSSSDTSSDSEDDGDEESNPQIIYGQHWIRSPTASLLPRLPSTPLVLSFRPSTIPATALLANDVPTPPATRHNPHPHSHSLPHGEDRILIVTSENKILEFHALAGKLTDWSRRNPTAVFPKKYTDLRDQARGVVWDVDASTQRVWIYGVSWLWMFDLASDMSNELQPQGGLPAGENGTVSASTKRKRNQLVGEDEELPRTGGTGAGSKIPAGRLKTGVGRKMQRIEGDEGDMQIISLERRRDRGFSGDDDGGDEDEEDEEEGNAENGTALVKLRRGEESSDDDDDEEEDQDDNDDDDGNDDGNAMEVDEPAVVNGNTEGSAALNKKIKQNTEKHVLRAPPHWHTFKYRPILGIVPLSSSTFDGDGDGEGEGEGNAESENENQGEKLGGRDEGGGGIEVALVERPLWEMDLPARFYGNQEWDP